MTEDLKNNKPELNESLAPSPAPSANAFIPPMSVKDIQATYEMLVNFKAAIRNNKWDGSDTAAVAMGLMMIAQMEAQYSSQLERAKKQDKEMAQKAREAIQNAGGQVNGNSPA